MRRVVLALLLPLLISAAAGAVELAEIERRIERLPDLRSDKPGYCLLVFGPQAALRVWLVRDGGVLYVDRNGNGDLTEPGERVEADPQSSRPDSGVFDFQAGDVVEGDATHKDLRVTWWNIDHMRDLNPVIKHRLEREPEFRGCRMSIDMALPGYRGTGIDGRVSHMTLIDDDHGLLAFSDKPEDAPIIHFGGPWKIMLPGQFTVRSGRTSDIYLVMGTPGVGPGTTVAVAYSGVVPEGLRPNLTFTYPAADDTTITRSYALSRRCCQVNLYGDVAVPIESVEGTARLEIALPGWSGAEVASSSYELPVLPPLPGPQLEPVSPRLTGKLEHEHPGEAIAAIQFSPDGQRLIAGDYPGGVVHVWDVATGKRLTTVSTGDGLRASHDYFVVTPDWKQIIAPAATRGKFERVSRDGKTLNRVTYDGAIHVWDLETGELLHTWKYDPPRSTRFVKLSPDGSHFFASEEVPAEFERSRPQALSLWETATGAHRDVVQGQAHAQAFSPDGHQVAVSIPRADNEAFHEAICLYEVPAWEEKLRIPMQGFCLASGAAFADGGRIVVGTLYTFPDPKNFNDRTCELKFWDAQAGKEIFSVPPTNKQEAFMWIKASPDGRTVVATTFDRDQNRGRILSIDVPTFAVNEIAPDTTQMPREPAFHPSGKWFVAASQGLPEGPLAREPSASELPQPHLLLVESATGEILEDVVAPQGFQTSMAFNPDGTVLATSGAGEVLLWDFHSPPGQLGAKPVVGQPLAIEGTLVGGQPLDAEKLRGNVVLVSYWATWCRPCVAEIPELRRVYEKFRDQGFEVVGVSLDDHGTKLDEFAKTQRVPWPIVCGTSEQDSGMHHPLAVKYRVESVPKSFLVDRQGNVAAIDPTLDELPALVEQLLAVKDGRQP